MSELSVREAGRDEAAKLLALWAAADSVPSVTDTLADLERLFDLTCARVLVAELDGNLLGSVIATFDGWRGNIYRLAVHPDYRRRGIATELVTRVDRWLVSAGAKRVSALTVRAHPWAVGFWNASDYTPDERLVRYVRTLP